MDITTDTVTIEVPFPRMLVLRAALKLEMKGFHRSRGQSAFTMVRKQFGLRGNKQRVYEQFNKLVEEVGKRRTMQQLTADSQLIEQAKAVLARRIEHDAH